MAEFGSKSPHGYFVTGTDTEVGKTAVAAALLRHLRDIQHQEVAGFKPVAAGIEMTDSGPRQSDVCALQKASSVKLPDEVVCPFCFEPAIAPHLAAKAVGRRMSVTLIQQAFTRFCKEACVATVVVEGAGGWLVPLNEEETMADVAVALGFPILLVVGIRLGCINHTLLTQESIQAHGGNLVGWIANCIDPEVSNIEEQIQTLQDRMNCPMYARFPHQAHAELDWTNASR